jgi:site-specific recombinase XerD
MGPVVALRAEPLPRKLSATVLTDKIIERLAVGERIFDARERGLYAKRLKTGVSFRATADLPKHARGLGRRTIEITLGHWPDISVAKARVAAKLHIATVKGGSDPRRPKVAADGLTLAQAWEIYRDVYAPKRGLRPATLQFYDYCYRRLIHWHNVPLAAIIKEPMAIEREHTRLTKFAKSHSQRKSDHGMNAADSSIGFLRLVYRYARSKYSDLPPWPERPVTMHGRRSRAARGMGPADLSNWWGQIRRIKNPVKRELTLFMLLSGLRSKDARSAKWEHLDEERRALFVPEPKGGTSRAFTLPTSNEILACVCRAKEAWLAENDRSEYIFPSARSKSGKHTDARAHFVDDEGHARKAKSGHDLRRTFANMAADAGVPEEIVAVLLNHKRRTVTANYQNPAALHTFYLEQMQKVSNKIDEVIRT